MLIPQFGATASDLWPSPTRKEDQLTLGCKWITLFIWKKKKNTTICWKVFLCDHPMWEHKAKKNKNWDTEMYPTSTYVAFFHIFNRCVSAMLGSKHYFSFHSDFAVCLGLALLCSLLITLFKYPRKTAVVGDILRVRGKCGSEGETY